MRENAWKLRFDPNAYALLLNRIEWSIEATLAIHELTVATFAKHERNAFGVSFDFLVFRCIECAGKGAKLKCEKLSNPRSPEAHDGRHCLLLCTNASRLQYVLYFLRRLRTSLAATTARHTFHITCRRQRFVLLFCRRMPTMFTIS
jgi:hypothetical protein